MNKSELIGAIAESADLTKADSGRIMVSSQLRIMHLMQKLMTKLYNEIFNALLI